MRFDNSPLASELIVPRLLPAHVLLTKVGGNVGHSKAHPVKEILSGNVCHRSYHAINENTSQIPCL